MRPFLACLAGVLLGTVGCQTGSSTGATPSPNRARAYAALPEETRQILDKGRLAEGMSSNVVAVAWGRPSKILPGIPPYSDERWSYYGSYTERRPIWTYTPQGNSYDRVDANVMPISHQYVRAVVSFWKGEVVQWEKFEPPQNP